MEFVRVGKSGLKVTQMVYGTWLTLGTEIGDEKKATAIIDKAWELGFRSFDNANAYGQGNSEILVGKALKKYNRDTFTIANKVFLANG